FVVNGRISAAKVPAAIAAATRAWLFTTYSSWASRVMPYFLDTKSAVWFIVHHTAGIRCCSGGEKKPGLLWVECTRVRLSAPAPLPLVSPPGAVPFASDAAPRTPA